MYVTFFFDLVYFSVCYPLIFFFSNGRRKNFSVTVVKLHSLVAGKFRNSCRRRKYQIQSSLSTILPIPLHRETVDVDVIRGTILVFWNRSRLVVNYQESPSLEKPLYRPTTDNQAITIVRVQRESVCVECILHAPWYPRLRRRALLIGAHSTIAPGCNQGGRGEGGGGRPGTTAFSRLARPNSSRVKIKRELDSLSRG